MQNRHRAFLYCNYNNIISITDILETSTIAVGFSILKIVIFCNTISIQLFSLSESFMSKHEKAYHGMLISCINKYVYLTIWPHFITIKIINDSFASQYNVL